MAAQNQGAAPNVDLFDAYFRRADLDRDGRISGNEAVAFFQGSNLPKNVLAQVWNYADQNRTGFLGRPEFYNALKLVTIAQSKRELTPDIVRAAFYGPASAKIPAPQINLAATPGPQPGVVAAPQTGITTQAGAIAGSPQNPAFRPPTSSSINVNQQFNPSQNNQLVRPSQPAPPLAPQLAPSGAARPMHGLVLQPGPVGAVRSMHGLAPQPAPGGAVRPMHGLAPQPAPSGAVRPMHGLASQPAPGVDARPLHGHAPGFSGVSSPYGPDLSNSRPQPVSAGDIKANGVPTGVGSQGTDRSISLPATQAGFGAGASGLMGMAPQLPASSGILPSTSAAKSPLTQNGFASGTFLGTDGLSANPSQKKDLSVAFSSTAAMPVSSVSAPVSAVVVPSVKQESFQAIQSLPTVQSGAGQPHRMQSLPKQHQQATAQGVSSTPGASLQATPAQPQQQWPKMTQTDVQKYTKVFVEVDKDKDGKITGEQARNLFLSWRLPREVLKQVWDLSDQDNDSMLSLREFCIALYLMERYREGRPLPSVLPSNIMYDSPGTVQTSAGPGHAAWGYSRGPQGPQQPGALGVGQRPPTRPPSGRPPLPVPVPHAENRAQPKQQKAKVPELEKHLLDQLSEEEQKSLNSKFLEAMEANKKVEELEKEIKESREKMEFYRAKMQELILYKSRCDNRLNEMTSRISSDKHEVEVLAKKYEEKYKQTGDVASRLTIEEATFRDIQERKMELYKAIVKLEQDGGTDESLKARVEQLQSNLEELVKSLNERCKTYGLRAKPTTLVELPFGWQPGIQEGAADWDEDWDKFEDEGFTVVKELTHDVKNIVAPPKTKAKPAKRGDSSADHGSEKAASLDAQAKPEKADSIFKEVDGAETREENAGSGVQKVAENGSAHEAGEVRSPAGSPAAKSSHESPRNEFHAGHFDKAGFDGSPSPKGAKSGHRGAESSFSGSKGFDDPGWGTFDHNDDVDSIWGGNPVSTSKAMEDDDLFGPGSFALNPIKTGSKFADSGFLKKGSSVFADSAPGTPFNSTYSPRKFSEGPDEHLPSFSRFDSFRSTDGSQTRELSRFDSMRSTDYEHGKGFPSFDDSDPFGSGPFRSSLGSETPRTEVDAFGAGPFRSSLGTETPRTDTDPFGAGPFRSTFGSETPRDSDPFGSRPFKSSFGDETPRDSDPFGSKQFKSSFGDETPRDSDPFGSRPFKSSFGDETPRDSDPFGSRPFKSSFGDETPRDSDPFGSGPFKSSFAETPRGDSDPLGSVGPFRSSFGSETPRSNWMGNETPRKDFDSFGYSGPFKSSFGSETPRSDSDPFGSTGPFRSSFGDETPRRDSDPFGNSGSFKSPATTETPKATNNWSAF